MCGVGLEQSVGGQAQYSTTACPAGVMPGKVFPACAKTRAKKRGRRASFWFFVFGYWQLIVVIIFSGWFLLLL